MSTPVATVQSDGQLKTGGPQPVSITVLAWLYICLAMAGLMTVGCFCLQVWLIPGWLGDTFLAFALPAFIFLSMILFLPALAGGIGLLRGKTWARVIVFLLSVLMIFVFPVGTILGGYGILALRAEQASPSSPAMVESRALRYRASRAVALVCGTLLGLAGIVAASTIVMGLWFRDRPDISPVSVETYDGAITILTGVAIAVALWWAASLVKRSRARDGQIKANTL
ncbi:hypothetical protein [Shinella zoogloeoides]|uniref:Uncharacterized protein n=1 Tax=Shinella zoogloeoides TaxID=352475 RepID=A0A6N8TLL6_SHIZO|nr:hypothetical protein [Shinella zoogloeoides]MXO02040.1 hypothetical protein [Shinella zoogloeoides]UEX81670.1 hypothetical protein K8M09_19275 [Shinella zoogloeoides]